MTAENSRRKAREVVLQALYALECGEVEADSTFSNILSETDLAPKSLEYAQFLPGAASFVIVRRSLGGLALVWSCYSVQGLCLNWRAGSGYCQTPGVANDGFDVEHHWRPFPAHA